MVDIAKERRSAARYEVRAPVIVKSTDGEKSSNAEGGFVHDISTEGALIWSTFVARLGQRLQLEVLLPPLPKSDKKFVLRSAGVVVREVADGFAIAGKFTLWRVTKLGARPSSTESAGLDMWAHYDDE